jgi:hypothetical protein
MNGRGNARLPKCFFPGGIPDHEPSFGEGLLLDVDLDRGTLPFVTLLGAAPG